eukprot:481226_1
MALKYSTVVSIVYFVLNIIFTFSLAYHVYKTGNHKLKSKSFVKDTWNQRKIFYPLLIHFYDTATDLGVIYNWAELAKDEAIINYESVDMKLFLWCGIAFLLVYRIAILTYTFYLFCIGDGEFYYIILALLDLYIFVVVYESFNNAQGVITTNAARRAENMKRKKLAQEANEKKRQQEIDRVIEEQEGKNKKLAELIAEQQGKTEALDELTRAIGMKDNNIADIGASEGKGEDVPVALDVEVEIEPVDKQMMIQVFEAVSESMPQIVLQSVFIVRSANDQALLMNGTNIGLILFSILASLFSIANKFVWFDKRNEDICHKAMSLHPRESFPDCIHYWYLIRVLWRWCHIFAKFAVFTLIWVVLGGAWLPVWIGLSFLFWLILSCIVFDHVSELLFISVTLVVAIIGISKECLKHFVYKW